MSGSRRLLGSERENNSGRIVILTLAVGLPVFNIVQINHLPFGVQRSAALVLASLRVDGKAKFTVGRSRLQLVKPHIFWRPMNITVAVARRVDGRRR